ncbi:MAG: SDR family oxidoreductase [Actinomycetota bacterium]
MTWRRAVVTGASSGIGAAMVRKLAEDGVPVVMVARAADRMEALAEELGVDSEILPADLGTAEGIAATAARLRSEEDPIDLLVNNAGFGFTGPFAELEIEGQQSSIDVNVSALVQLSHAAATVMVERAGGTILNVSSVAGSAPTPGNAVYGATKAFVTSFSQGLHEELRPHNVKVTCLAPGFTRTEFQDRAGYDTTSLPSFVWQSAEEVAAIGLEAARKGRAVVVPGAQNKALVGTTKLLPGAVQRRLAGLFDR